MTQRSIRLDDTSTLADIPDLEGLLLALADESRREDASVVLRAISDRYLAALDRLVEAADRALEVATQAEAGNVDIVAATRLARAQGLAEGRRQSPPPPHRSPPAPRPSPSSVTSAAAPWKCASRRRTEPSPSARSSSTRAEGSCASWR